MEAAFLLGKPIGGEGSGQKERIDKMDKLVILWVVALWFTAAVAILWAIETAEKLIESRRKDYSIFPALSVDKSEAPVPM